MEVTVAALRDVKRALTVQGDIASDVAFQNDVNALLAAVARLAGKDTLPAADTPAVERRRVRAAGR